ncbi:uncharacterized protein LOC115390701 isoform X2 [Salarias fasciatus]|uniref:uncharacterized protein LOC115390701 isoform X2 n=1 Tax=Salarias fasciatus TaxID=181472 RepID=UPI001177017B|nr:uncharacterized protein LOC115390701 isoform X2 [Salarias fasciatus]
MAEGGQQRKKPKVLSEETKKRKREATRIKAQSRINIGPAFTRWRELKDEEGFPTDAALALFLLDNAHFSDDDYVSPSPGQSQRRVLKSAAVPASLAVPSVINTDSLSTRLPSQPRVRNKATQTGPNTPPVSHQSAFQLVYVPVRCSAPPQDSRSTSPPGLPPVEDVESESDNSSTQTNGVSGGEPTCVVFESCLRELFQRCPVCEHRCEVQRCQLGTCVSFAQLCSRCQYSRRWQSEPLQHRVRNLESSADQVESFTLVHEQEDKTAVAGRLPGLYRCSDPLSDVSVTEQNTPQHIVDEDSILQLMKNCPICRKSCRCTKRSRGPYLVVHQSCYFCHYRRKWTSQPEAQLLNVYNTNKTKRRRKEKAPAEVHLKI